MFFASLTDVVAAGWHVAAFGVFCLLSSGVYCANANDVLDREADGRHPRKRRRPVALTDPRGSE